MVNNFSLRCSLNVHGWSEKTFHRTFAYATRRGGIPSLCVKPKLQPEHVGRFLHEITHHLIFDSPVATALTILEKRARQTAEPFDKPMDVNPESEVAILEFQMRRSAVSALLRPLNEGLALFAQHDSYCRRLPITSKALRWGVRLFSGGHYQPHRHELEKFRNLLDDYRWSDEQLRSKEKLLTRPLVSRTGKVVSYRAAYLGLKYAFLYSLLRHEFFGMADYFTTYAIAFFFEDERLVELLLAPRSPSIDDAIRYTEFIEKYVTHRFHSFIASLVDASPDFWLASTPWWAPVNVHLPNRELMRLATIDARLQRANRNTALARFDAGVLDLEYLHFSEQPEGAVTLDYCISPAGEYEAYIASARGIPVAVGLFADEEPMPIQDRVFIDAITPEAASESGHGDSLAAFTSRLEAHRHLTAVRKRAIESANSLYSAFALLGPPESAFEHATALIPEKLLAVLHNRHDLSYRSAVVKTYLKTFPDDCLAAVMCAQEGADVDATLNELHDHAENAGVSLPMEFRRRLFSTA